MVVVGMDTASAKAEHGHTMMTLPSLCLSSYFHLPITSLIYMETLQSSISLNDRVP
jgi:hypothetical protein